jgi:hypothetical protein
LAIRHPADFRKILNSVLVISNGYVVGASFYTVSSAWFVAIADLVEKDIVEFLGDCQIKIRKYLSEFYPQLIQIRGGSHIEIQVDRETVLKSKHRSTGTTCKCQALSQQRLVDNLISSRDMRFVQNIFWV